ncbi:unnamed protein product [Paramecium pentaurelia]|uniref:Uncharacterized protein n=1 Tax=Paramecium pentaurelia TaxID=43138 RepID=A0A8S1SK22_9CILI|nr:unnamed protein product [Paramecium pentaurelia]
MDGLRIQKEILQFHLNKQFDQFNYSVVIIKGTRFTLSTNKFEVELCTSTYSYILMINNLKVKQESKRFDFIINKITHPQDIFRYIKYKSNPIFYLILVQQEAKMMKILFKTLIIQIALRLIN